MDGELKRRGASKLAVFRMPASRVESHTASPPPGTGSSPESPVNSSAPTIDTHHHLYSPLFRLPVILHSCPPPKYVLRSVIPPALLPGPTRIFTRCEQGMYDHHHRSIRGEGKRLVQLRFGHSLEIRDAETILPGNYPLICSPARSQGANGCFLSFFHVV